MQGAARRDEAGEAEEAAIRREIRARLGRHLPKDVDGAGIGDDTPLITGGLLDSVAALDLVDSLESEYGIEFTREELDPAGIDTIRLMAGLIQGKRRAS